MDAAPLSAWSPRILSLLRIVAGLLFMEHGTQKLLGFPIAQDLAAMSPPLMSLSGIAGVFELVGGFLIAIGLFSRPVAFLLSGQMAGGYFLVHFGSDVSLAAASASRSFYPLLNKGELAILYCFTFLYLFFAGPGPWSVDALRSHRI
ncbi:MAG: DoxX family protein [Hansschlegelia sp.]